MLSIQRFVPVARRKARVHENRLLFLFFPLFEAWNMELGTWDKELGTRREEESSLMGSYVFLPISYILASRETCTSGNGRPRAYCPNTTRKEPSHPSFLV